MSGGASRAPTSAAADRVGRSGNFAIPGQTVHALASIPTFRKLASTPAPFRRWCAPNPTPRSKFSWRSVSRSRSTRIIPTDRCANAASIIGAPAIHRYFAAARSCSSCGRLPRRGCPSSSGWSISPPGGLPEMSLDDHGGRQPARGSATRASFAGTTTGRLPTAP